MTAGSILLAINIFWHWVPVLSLSFTLCDIGEDQKDFLAETSSVLRQPTRISEFQPVVWHEKGIGFSMFISQVNFLGFTIILSSVKRICFLLWCWRMWIWILGVHTGIQILENQRKALHKQMHSVNELKDTSYIHVLCFFHTQESSFICSKSK